MATLRVGDPLDKNTDVGAINSKAQLEQDPRARRERARRRAPRSTSRRASSPSKGYWFAPTFFTGVAQSHRIAQEEIFGPVLSRAHVPHAGRGGREGEQHDVRPLGRASGRRRARRSSGWRERLRAGVVWANTFNRFDPTSPFGGYKESGFGREGGRQGLGRT